MTMVEGPTGFVIFREPWSAGGDPEPEPAIHSSDVSADYCRARELAERAAAKRATSARARSVHQELAQHYARRALRAAPRR
jgi:hypothetical protein